MTKVLEKHKINPSLRSGLVAVTPAISMVGSNTVFAADGTGIDHHGIGASDTVNVGDDAVSVNGNLSQSESGGKAFTKILNKIRIWVMAFFGFAVLAMLAVFTWHALHLASSSGNTNDRAKHVQSMGIDFAIMAVLGAISWIAGIAYNTI